MTLRVLDFVYKVLHFIKEHENITVLQPDKSTVLRMAKLLTDSRV